VRSRNGQPQLEEIIDAERDRPPGGGRSMCPGR
jgi:hypothetical protein